MNLNFALGSVLSVLTSGQMSKHCSHKNKHEDMVSNVIEKLHAHIIDEYIAEIQNKFWN